MIYVAVLTVVGVLGTIILNWVSGQLTRSQAILVTAVWAIGVAYLAVNSNWFILWAWRSGRIKRMQVYALAVIVGALVSVGLVMLSEWKHADRSSDSSVGIQGDPERHKLPGPTADTEHKDITLSGKSAREVTLDRRPFRLFFKPPGRHVTRHGPFPMDLDIGSGRKITVLGFTENGVFIDEQGHTGIEMRIYVWDRG
jgi:hypothetical protein